MSDIGNVLARAFVIYLVIFGTVCVGVGALAVWGLPKLWAWLKPIIHTVTG